MMIRSTVFLFTAVAASASAQTAAPKPVVSPACRAELVALCPQGDDRSARRQCMMQSRGKVSDSCRAEIRAARDARRGGSGDMAAPGAMATDPVSPTKPQ